MDSKGRRKSTEFPNCSSWWGSAPIASTAIPMNSAAASARRIGIARALAPRPKLLIADEPVSSLDVSVQAQVLNLFSELKRKLKLTMLFISHDLNVVEYLADTVAVMYAGKMMEVAPVEQIFNLPLHPYTQGLIASNPSPESYMERRYADVARRSALAAQSSAGMPARTPLPAARRTLQVGRTVAGRKAPAPLGRMPRGITAKNESTNCRRGRC